MGYKIINTDIMADREGSAPCECLIANVLQKESQIEPDVNKVIMDSVCKNRVCISHETQQNTKMCEVKTELLSSVTDFVDETNLKTETNIDFLKITKD